MDWGFGFRTWDDVGVSGFRMIWEFRVKDGLVV